MSIQKLLTLYTLPNSPNIFELFLQDGIVAVADEAGTLGFGVFDIREWSKLNAKQLVVGCAACDEGQVLLFLEGIDQRFGIVLLADGGNLHKISAGCRRGRGLG